VTARIAGTSVTASQFRRIPKMSTRGLDRVSQLLSSFYLNLTVEIIGDTLDR